MSQPIRFFYQGRVQEVDSAAPTRTVLQHLREDLHCTGTKEGCAEGDCGACTVVIGSLVDGELEMRNVNSCIQFLPTLDGKAVFTVEDLKQPDGSLHPVQEALVECHGSQCGFCTPGFAMSLWSLYLKQEGQSAPPCRKTIDETLSGNLCRCTGYRPIIDAAARMGELPAVGFDRAALKAVLQGLQRDTMFSYTHDGQTFHAPRTLAEMAALRAAKPAATILAGSTDVGLWVTKQMRNLGDVIYTRQLHELHRIATVDGKLEIGAAVSLDDAYQAVLELYPNDSLHELWQRFASQPIRSTGTLGGSVANGSPIGDSAPWMIVLGAEIVLRSDKGQRVLLLQDFYLDYMKKDWQPGEFVEAVRIPAPKAGQQFRTYKLAKRYDQDISAVCAAFSLEVDSGVVRNAHIAYGGMAATSRRAPLAEAAINGQPWNEATLRAGMEALAKDYTPLTDMRASANYRMRTAQNLLRRFWMETRPEDAIPGTYVNAYAFKEGAAA
ncbi:MULTISPECIES: xanthine dehydrogenase small subunit [unclassified Duganella]|uniref:xanthine dehydrogenase small subunit n=1 Tax=unclassified Duganella TaxID=2636909 RepID=UPI0006FB9B31|nr:MULTISPECIES: xanthine dehydrogenase small subunit [unclassified Duganella]KQV61688.1 FAD-binding molybdopterin dehydrogenase [Duganella sp. Root336D2]KRB84411.1 FAD-binding molybdopterin dehydrogenase [Duganella sp. Root198D2]